MGLFSRLAQLIKSNINDLISKSEDPEKMLNQVVLDMNNQLVEAKKQVAASIADEKRLAKQCEQEQANAAEWERRAMMALRAGNEELAREALNRKKEHDTLATTFKEQWQKQKDAVEKLKSALRMLNDKIEEAKRKKNVLIARKKRAEAQQAIQATMSGLKDQSAFETFDRMTQKIDQMEAEAEAGEELQEEYSGDTLAAQFSKLEKKAGADDELEALKRKMGLAPGEAPKPEVKEEVAARVEAPAERVEKRVPPASTSEQDELAAALEEMEAEAERDKKKMGR
jgi:phage shock protein A